MLELGDIVSGFFEGCLLLNEGKVIKVTKNYVYICLSTCDNAVIKEDRFVNA